jgi:hypothetical protein
MVGRNEDGVSGNQLERDTLPVFIRSQGMGGLGGVAEKGQGDLKYAGCIAMIVRDVRVVGAPYCP